MFRNTNLLIAGTLVALATAPANAFHKGTPHGDSQFLGAILDLLEPKIIFVTSERFTGDLVTQANALLGTQFSASEGLEAGDALCQDLADAPGSIVPEDEYVALLSTDDVHASGRITPSSGPYIRPDGVPIAANFDELFSTLPLSNVVNLTNPPVVNELGVASFAAPVSAWTGSRSRGVGSGTNCDGWSTDLVAEFGDSGIFTSRDITWDSGVASHECNSSFRLYCVQR